MKRWLKRLAVCLVVGVAAFIMGGAMFNVGQGADDDEFARAWAQQHPER